MSIPTQEAFRALPRSAPSGTPNGFQDARDAFRELTVRTPPDLEFRRQFARKRRQTAAANPIWGALQRRNALRELDLRGPFGYGPEDAPPIPGGVGYGMFYAQSFLVAFVEGTALYWEIVCPADPGGNVSGYLYLTGMNRASRGVEALIKYFGRQTSPSFIVYDWARAEADRWQHEIPFPLLGAYLREDTTHGLTFNVLPLMNMTYQVDAASWLNQVWLLNRSSNNWDLIYQFEYAAVPTDQHGPFVGSWGPIVETFQDTYSDTSPMGALNTQLSTHLNGQWGAWSALSQSQSQLTPNSKGFLPTFLDPNTSWVVHS
jgi:hypothetical protein